jgi:type II secretory pathway pseudopilin PulG
MKPARNGFTYIEIMISAVLMGLVIMGLAKLWQLWVAGYDFSFDETIAISQAQGSMTTMEREIREMRDGEDGSYPLVTADDHELVFMADTDNDGSVERVRYYVVGTDLIKQTFAYQPDVSNYACVGGCTICHNDEVTLTIPETAWPAHSAQGDYLGECVPGGPPGGIPPSTTTEKVVASYLNNDLVPMFAYFNGDWPGDTINNPLPVGERLLNTRLIRPTVVVNVEPSHLPGDVVVTTLVQLRNLKDNL